MKLIQYNLHRIKGNTILGRGYLLSTILGQVTNAYFLLKRCECIKF